MISESPRLGLVVDPSEPHRYPAHDLLAAALDDGWSAEIVYDRTAPRIRDIVPLLRAIRHRPAEVLRTARPQKAPPGRRLRLATVMLAPRLLHLPSIRTAPAWIGLARRLGARTLVNVSDDELNAMAFDGPPMDGPAWSTADSYHVESEALAGLLSQLNIPDDRIAVIPPAVDEPLLAQKPRSENGAEPLRILTVGPLSWTRCHEHAIHAIRVLRDRGIVSEYRIVGAGAHLDAVIFAIHQLGLQEEVAVIESCSPAELRAHLRWARVFVQLAVVPSSSETILQAHAAGVPVITTTPAADVAQSTFGVPALDSGAVADALARIQRDHDLRMSLITRGRERAQNAPTPAERATRLHRLHRVLVGDV